jgi:hypothetical protein
MSELAIKTEAQRIAATSLVVFGNAEDKPMSPSQSSSAKDQHRRESFGAPWLRSRNTIGEIKALVDL